MNNDSTKPQGLNQDHLSDDKKTNLLITGLKVTFLDGQNSNNTQNGFPSFLPPMRVDFDKPFDKRMNGEGNSNPILKPKDLDGPEKIYIPPSSADDIN